MIWAIRRFIGNNSYCVWKGRLHRFWQRMTRGWDDSDLWSLDYTMAHWVLPRLKEYKKQCHGMPMKLPPVIDQEDGEAYYFTHDEWDAVLDKMILAFELIAYDEIPLGGCFDDYQAKYKAREKKIEEGIVLFGLYFRALWN